MTSSSQEPPSERPPDLGRTDLASLLSAEASERAAAYEAEGRRKPAKEALKRAKPAAGPRTDIDSLRAALPPAHRRPLQRTVADFMLLGLAPTLVFVMITSVVMFLLDVRYVYTEVHDSNLRFVASMYLLGIVALNRLVARDGQEESFLYVLALAAAIGLYTITTTGVYEVGSVARGFMNTPWLAALFNMTLAAFLWWMTNRLTHECCVDENPVAGEIGILTGTLRKVGSGVRKRIEEAQTAQRPDVYDPIEGWKPKQKRLGDVPGFEARLPKRHPGMSIFYFSIPVMLLFILGQRVLLQGGKPLVMAGHFYVGLYTFSALTLLMTTSLEGLRAYFRTRYIAVPAGLAPFWIGVGLTMTFIIVVAATALPLPSPPPIAHVDRHETDFWTQNSKFRLKDAAATPVQIMEQAQVARRAGQVTLAILGLFLAYSALRALGFGVGQALHDPHRYSPRIMRALERIDRLLQRIGQLPKASPRTRRIRVAKDVARSSRYSNPLGQGEEARMTPPQMVAYTYDALCALAEDLGVPRKPSQTPYEFMEAFPKPLESLRDEAFALTQLLVQSDYAGRALDAHALDRLRAFWVTYRRVRGRFVR